MEAGAVEDPNEEAVPRSRRCRYRPWAELMMRTFGIDVLYCMQDATPEDSLVATDEGTEPLDSGRSRSLS